MDINKYFFDKKESYLDPNLNIELFKLFNFKTISNSGSLKHFNGQYFAIKYGVHYGHLLIDYLGQYLYLKKIYPNLKLIFFKYEKSDIYFTCNKPSQDIVDFFNAEIINLNDQNCSFDELIFFYREDLEITGIPNLLKIDPNAKFILPIIPSKLFLDKFYFIDESSNEFINYATTMLKCVYEKFQNYLINENTNNNIYITREVEHKRNNLFKDQEWFKQTKERYTEDSEELKKEIENIGYKIINLNGMGFFEQINIFYNAKNIITQDGTGIINCIWAKPESKIFKIIVNNKYKYPWNTLINLSRNININNINIQFFDNKNYIKSIINGIK